MAPLAPRTLGLDPDLLRAFVLIAEGGSFTRAADRLGRTQSAVSMQIRRLEELLGHPLLVRTPRGVQATPQGAWLLDRARDLLALNDEIIGNFRAPPMVGSVRLGTPDDYALNWLPTILARFAEAHPAVELDVTCLNSDVLVDKFRDGQLDLTLVSEGQEPPGVQAQRIWRGPLRWVGSPAHGLHRRDPLPLALSRPNENPARPDHACAWRSAALEALQAAGRPARVTYNSATQTGCFTVALAGLALTVSTPTTLPLGLSWMGEAEGLPPLPDMGILLLRQPAARGVPAVDTLAEHITEGFLRASDGTLALPAAATIAA
ncbi:LysR family transcriptional regulator [Falsiroseomonas sp.]|uniref:LysR family transcriptional regulator n=1 Tax=Falsiroseomonas sp. TaxID=2870721 RepID=UPI00271DECD1|nr:LysR family transcriptional regulator [Falsiroseomonas sp.]MDO9499048.1 LysR family transcriptional regulator [Falsiroseomonas sp.]MDP3414650.1 LysR family transcriptional regulator [Falsiroseomonas sp.]